MTDFPIRPILGRVIVRIERTGEVLTDSGIISRLDSKRAEAANRGCDRIGVIVAIDEKHEDAPDGVNVGDRVFFQSSWQGETWTWDNATYHTMEGYDVAMLVEDGVRIEAQHP